MKEFIVYAAGPITGCSYDGCTDWRSKLQREFNALLPKGFQVHVASPMRGKDYFAGTESIHAPNGQYNFPAAYATSLSSMKGIITRDSYDCLRADLVFVNFLEATQVSIGTVMEIAWAYLNRIPVVAAMEANNPHQHGMLLEACGFILPTFDVAVKVAANVLLPTIDGLGRMTVTGDIAA